jgi:glycosyltransferase involved in cell wall biosynthesis
VTAAPQPRPATEIQRGGASGSKRIAYVQYTNPAGYPPLEHSSQILADDGWDVLFLGAEIKGAADLRFPGHSRIRVRQFGRQKAGWRQKLHYLFFCAWCLAWILRHRSSWVYASDLFSCPVAAVAGAIFRIPVIYHEHDSPDPHPASRFLRLCLWTRAVCARRAQLCILPNSRRAALFSEQTKSSRPAVIWNCPNRREVAEARGSEGGGVTRFLYHGSIVPDRLPLSVVDALAAMPGECSLTVVGYETAGSVGYMEALRRRAAELGIERRLNLIGTLVGRQEVLDVCLRHDVGLSLMPLVSQDFNLCTMTGASNKPFDYLSAGLALLVSQLADWEEMFVAPGYAVACDPSQQQSLEAALRWFIEHPEETRAMGAKGHQRILSEWNYEAQFQPAFDVLQRKPPPYGSERGRRSLLPETSDAMGEPRPPVAQGRTKADHE